MSRESFNVRFVSRHITDPMKTNLSFRVATLLGTLCLLTPALAHAHPGHGPGDFGEGFVHPFTGFDHLLAMLAVSLWSVQLGSRAVWLLPATFVGAISFGSFLGSLGVPVPLVEHGIVASLLVLGLLVAVAARLSLKTSVASVGAFAVFHGGAHAAEISGSASGSFYIAGVIAASALVLLATGVGLARFAAQEERAAGLRWAGAAIAFTGLMLSLQ